MIWQALYQRGQAKRTLIITPAGLTTQWQEEMQEKFGMTFEIFGRDFLAVNPRVWDFKAAAIASIDRLKRAEHRRILLENRKWDLIIFDEAHRLGAQEYGAEIKKTQNYRLAEELRTKDYCEAFLLLTATPHQGEENHSRFRSLLALLDDDIDFSSLEPLELFRGAPGDKPYSDYVIRTPKKDVTDAEGRKVFKGRQTHRLSCKMHDDEQGFYEAVARYIRTGYQTLEREIDPAQKRATGFLLTTFQKLNASSTAAIRATLEARLARLNGRLEALPPPEDTEPELFDERYEGEHEEREAVFLSDRQLLENEVDTLKDLLDRPVRKDKKLDDLLKLIDRIG